jgi:predicted nucleic acid-binding protein
VQSRETLLLDACVVINLYASGYMQEVIGALPGHVAIVDLVRAESLAIRSSEDETDQRETIDLSPLVDRGLIEVLSATGDEFDTFIDLAVTLDDGEAMTAALAIRRGYSIATDDRAAIRVLAGRVPIVSTLELVKLWADMLQISSDHLRDALTSLQVRGSYVPGRGHPLRSWWDQALDEE